MAIAEARRGFMVSAVNSLFEDGSTPRIESDPRFFWELARRHGTFLGEVADGWFAMVPENQSVPEQGDGVHLMIAPRREVFVTPSTLTATELEVGASFVLSFLNYARQAFPDQIALAGWNISTDPADRRPRPQSWPNFHIHGMILPSKLMPLDHFPRPFRDMGRDSMESLLSQLMAVDAKDAVEQVSVESQRENIGQLLPRGGVLYRLRSSESSTVAAAIKQLHQQYQQVHKRVFSVFVENYDEVKDNQWRIAYKLRSPWGVGGQIIAAGFSDRLMKALYNYNLFLRDEASVDKERKLYRSPSYSTALFMGQDGAPYMFFHPHLVRISGFPHALGIHVRREQQDGASIEDRLARARSLFENLLVDNLQAARLVTSQV